MQGTIKLQCVGCKKKRDLTLEQAATIVVQPCCQDCGMPEIAISGTAKSRRSGKDLRHVFGGG